MNRIFHQQTKKTIARPDRVSSRSRSRMSLRYVANHAAAQTVTPPPTPTLITPPVGNTAFLVGHALGTQGYVCLPTGPGASTASWTVNAARPEATLFTKFFGQDVQIITHFLSPDEKPKDPTQAGALRQRDVAELIR